MQTVTLSLHSHQHLNMLCNQYGPTDLHAFRKATKAVAPAA